MKLTGKRAVITGASQGIGFSIATFFAEQGADVLICGRSPEDLQNAQQQISGQASGKVYAKTADVSIEDDVKTLAQFAVDRMGGIDVLVCNAGIYGPKGPTEEVDWSDWVQTLNINLLGSVLCCRLFLPYLKQSTRGKIILLSGGGATKPLPFFSAYAASKAAVVRFGETLAHELIDKGIDVNCVAPGACNTRMLQEALDAGPEKVGKAYYAACLKQKDSGGTPVEAGAGLCVFLASAESDGITGKLISAVWDPWQELPNRRENLTGTDIYTLRRILPKERGLSWG